jgi:hypothetical protein
MDNDGEQGRAEPQEWSRWEMICVLGCAGVALVSMSFYVLGDEPDSRILLFLLFLLPGVFLFAIAFVSATEQRHGVNPHAEWSIDKILLL